MTASDLGQIVGAVFILAGYWLMARSTKWSALALLIGCVIWAIWALFDHAYWLAGLEVILGAMSVRTFWINRRA